MSSGALRLAGGPGGVEDHRGVLAAGVGHLAVGLVLAEELLELAGGDLDDLCFGILRAHGEVLPGEDELCAGVLQVEADLTPLEQDVHRHDDATCAQDAVVGDGEVGDVGQHDPYPVARLEALGPQHRRGPGASLLELGVGDGYVVELERRPVAVTLGGLGQEAGEVAAHVVCLRSLYAHA